jgi:hypothetical protein
MSRLTERFSRPLASWKPPLTIAQILSWADAYHAVTGHWPSGNSGPIRQAVHGETWGSINCALGKGHRGLPAGLSLARLLQQERGLKPKTDLETMRAAVEETRALMAERRGGQATLTPETIVAWADAHHAATGRWPTFRSGRVAGVPGETWNTINQALCRGRRGLPGGSTLARLLVAHRGRAALNGPPELVVEHVLAWADAYRAAHGHWPTDESGVVADAPSETWRGISLALQKGHRGLPGGSSLARLLAQRRGTRNRKALAPLSIDQILAWADAHHAATGEWPARRSGPVRGAPGDTWGAIDSALLSGGRGLPGRSSLPGLLDEHRPERMRLLSLETIRAWAEAHRQVHGLWPAATSGPVADAPGEDWAGIDTALRMGRRGLPGGTSLAQLFGRSVDPTLRGDRPKLSLEQVLAWGDAYHADHGRWPRPTSGPVAGAPGERWVNIEQALRTGRRGLPAGLSLAKLFAGRPVPVPPPPRDGQVS